MEFIAIIFHSQTQEPMFLSKLDQLDSSIHILSKTQLSDECLQIKFKSNTLSLEDFKPLQSFYISVFPYTIFHQHKRLIIFDMDSTLIQQEVIDEIAKYAGVEDQVSKITEEAMQGTLDFKQSLFKRVSLLDGLSSNIFEQIKSKITFTKGARELTFILKRLGYKMAVVSGGFLPLALYIKKELDLDYAFANQLEVVDHKLTGKVMGDIVDAKRKQEILITLMQSHGLVKDQVIAVGDGANDLLMLSSSGLGIAFNAKPKVQEQSHCRINSPSLLNVLYFLGFDEAQMNAFLSIKLYPE